jgi:ribosomal protein S18 acetylase RimI-like enzyme
VEIRRVRRDDVKWFIEVYQRAYANLPEYAYTRRREIRSYFNWLLGRDQEGFMVAEVGKPVGFVACDTNWISYYSDEKVGEIHELFVLPEFRNRGIGSSLLLKALDYARNRNRRVAELWVGEKNENAKIFYKKFGFKEEGVWGKWVRMIKYL